MAAAYDEKTKSLTNKNPDRIICPDFCYADYLDARILSAKSSTVVHSLTG